jgi:hypothetical protein
LVGAAVYVIELPAHSGFVPDVIAIVTDGVKIGFTVIAIELDVAVAGLTQLAFEVSIHVITSVFTNVVLVNILAFVPVFAPFIFH